MTLHALELSSCFSALWQCWYRCHPVVLQISRGVVGRLMADPAFMQKLLIEQVLTIGSSIAWEWQQRGQRLRQELDLAAINTLCLAAGSAAMVWMSAPTRSHGSLGKMPWQAMLHAMPNNVFDASTPLRNYNSGTRAGAFAVKLAELCAVGTLTGQPGCPVRGCGMPELARLGVLQLGIGQ